MLALVLLIAGAAAWLRAERPPLDLAPGSETVRWEPVDLNSGGVVLAGAWRLHAGDRRLGGFSGLALDRGRLLGLTDGGMLAWLPLPGEGGRALVRPLPAVAGDPGRKPGRDSEALAADADGWWVAFEQNHQIIRYDRDFRRALRRVRLRDTGFRPNRGVEALVAGSRLRLYPEQSGVSDAVRLSDGTVLLLKRRFGFRGFTASLEGPGGETIRLPVGPFDNPEGMTAEPRPGGGHRIWVITDDDQTRWRRTLLLAIDLPPTRAS